MEIHAFVLHLTRADKRRENAHELLENCGLAGEIWPAVDGAALTAADLSSTVGAELFPPPYPFALKTGEIGCFLSHRQIWAEIVHRNLDAALVLEDDVSLDLDSFDEALDLAIQYVETYGYVQLQNRPTRGAETLIDKHKQCTLTQPVITPVRASAQLISRAAAQHLLDKSAIFDRPVDTYVQSHWFTGLRPAVIYPSGISTISDQLDGSTIQIGRKTALGKLRREIARMIYRMSLKRQSRRSQAPTSIEPAHNGVDHP